MHDLVSVAVAQRERDLPPARFATIGRSVECAEVAIAVATQPRLSVVWATREGWWSSSSSISFSNRRSRRARVSTSDDERRRATNDRRRAVARVSTGNDERRGPTEPSRPMDLGRVEGRGVRVEPAGGGRCARERRAVLGRRGRRLGCARDHVEQRAAVRELAKESSSSSSAAARRRRGGGVGGGGVLEGVHRGEAVGTRFGKKQSLRVYLER